MVYLALLRGINVGGNRKVEMAKLKQTFERLGFSDVKTFIASGNVIFAGDKVSETELVKKIEAAIEKDFGFKVDTLIRNQDEIERLVQAIPNSWVNNKEIKCDVMFLWPEVDHPKILDQIPTNPEIEDIKYFPGTIIWRIDRSLAGKSKVLKLNSTKLYKQMTIRNPNTVRQIYTLMQAADQ
jgi:uncharacterized protein (DUF1697 family)